MSVAPYVSRSKPARPALLSGSPLSSVARPESAASADPALDSALRYASLEDRVQALVEEWPRLESQIIARYPDFLRLSEDERALIPEAGRFQEIQTELDRLDEERERLLPVVLQSQPKTPAAVMAKLRVAQRLVHPDDHPEANRLIGDSIKDLDRLLSDFS